MEDYNQIKNEEIVEKVSIITVGCLFSQKNERKHRFRAKRS